MQTQTLALITCLGSAAPKPAATDGPAHTKDNQLLRPADYRNWGYLSASVGLQYGPNAPANSAARRLIKVNDGDNDGWRRCVSFVPPHPHAAAEVPKLK